MWWFSWGTRIKKQAQELDDLKAEHLELAVFALNCRHALRGMLDVVERVTHKMQRRHLVENEQALLEALKAFSANLRKLLQSQ